MSDLTRKTFNDSLIRARVAQAHRRLARQTIQTALGDPDLPAPTRQVLRDALRDLERLPDAEATIGVTHADGDTGALIEGSVPLKRGWRAVGSAAWWKEKGWQAVAALKWRGKS
jgi:hypothetical protein